MADIISVEREPGPVKSVTVTLTGEEARIVAWLVGQTRNGGTGTLYGSLVNAINDGRRVTPGMSDANYSNGGINLPQELING